MRKTSCSQFIFLKLSNKFSINLVTKQLIIYTFIRKLLFRDKGVLLMLYNLNSSLDSSTTQLIDISTALFSTTCILQARECLLHISKLSLNICYLYTL